MRIHELITEGLDVDVPNEEWLDDAREYARGKARNQFGVPFMGKTTAYTTSDYPVPVAILKNLPGKIILVFRISGSCSGKCME